MIEREYHPPPIRKVDSIVKTKSNKGRSDLILFFIPEFPGLNSKPSNPDPLFTEKISPVSFFKS